MNNLTDSEVLARLIYRAYIAPDPHAPLETEALLPFTAALELYARTWGKEKRDKESYGMLLRMAAEAGVKLPEETASGSDAPPEPLQPSDTPVSEPDTPADDAALEALDAEQPHITGYASAEKKEIFARLHAFCATHGLGARKMIADASAGELTISELLDMMSSARVQLAKWRAAAAAMDRIEEKENAD